MVQLTFFWSSCGITLQVLQLQDSVGVISGPLSHCDKHSKLAQGKDFLESLESRSSEQSDGDTISDSSAACGAAGADMAVACRERPSCLPSCMEVDSTRVDD